MADLFIDGQYARIVMVSIRKATPDDTKAILELHWTVARISQGIARTETELTESYINTLFRTTDIMLVGINETNQVVAEIHASKYGLSIFDHILTGLTIAVHPDCQGKGIGKRLFQTFLIEVQQLFPEVVRIELESRASNQKSIGLYQSVGFVEEGRMINKTRNEDGTFEDSILMAWTKPGFDFTN